VDLALLDDVVWVGGAEAGRLQLGAQPVLPGNWPPGNKLGASAAKLLKRQMYWLWH